MRKLDGLQITILVLMILIVGIGAAGYFSFRLLAKKIDSLQSTQATIPANTSAAAPGSVIVQVTPDASAAVLGQDKAKVTLIEFADFQCPYCDQFFKDAEPALISKYVNTGKVKFIFEDFAILGLESEDAAEAAKCAQKQDMFWQYHDYLYSHQNGENKGAFSDANLESFAKLIPGLNTTDFNKCLDSHTPAADVQRELNNGLKAGVNSTPTVFINGHAVVGVYSVETYEKIIDDLLAGK